jgi:hypothetical protein
MTPVTLPAVDFPDVIREGCALVTTRDGWCATGTALVAAAAAADGRVRISGGADYRLDSLAIDLTRASGQWAVACWLVAHGSDVNLTIIIDALRGKADPAELRRVALAVRGATVA